MLPPIHVFVDFDGTIALRDTTDDLLRQYARPEWVDAEAAWERNEIGSRECMGRQVALLRVSPATLDAFVDEVEIDPGFPAFVDSCRALGIRMTVVSDGLDRIVAGVLSGHGLSLPIRANRLHSIGSDRWALSFPHAQAGCRSLSGHCKCHSLGEKRMRVLIGDGRSDVCAAEAADLVCAKGRLLKFCQATGLPCIAYTTFADLTPVVAHWRAAVSREAPARRSLQHGPSAC